MSPVLVDPPTTTPVPCAARPSTRFHHLDGPCQCFFGGPAPVFGRDPLSEVLGAALQPLRNAVAQLTFS